MTESLRSALKQLRLSGLLESLDVRLHEAAGNGLNHAEFLELLLQDELAVRSDRQVRRRVSGRNRSKFAVVDHEAVDHVGVAQINEPNIVRLAGRSDKRDVAIRLPGAFSPSDDRLKGANPQPQELYPLARPYRGPTR